MNEETLNATVKTLELAKDTLDKVIKESVETKQVPDLSKRITVEFAFMKATLMCLEALLRAKIEKIERCENNDRD